MLYPLSGQALTAQRALPGLADGSYAFEAYFHILYCSVSPIFTKQIRFFFECRNRSRRPMKQLGFMAHLRGEVFLVFFFSSSPRLKLLQSVLCSSLELILHLDCVLVKIGYKMTLQFWKNALEAYIVPCLCTHSNRFITKPDSIKILFFSPQPMRSAFSSAQHSPPRVPGDLTHTLKDTFRRFKGGTQKSSGYAEPRLEFSSDCVYLIGTKLKLSGLRLPHLPGRRGGHQECL